MRRDWSPEDLVGAWTLVEGVWRLLGNKTGATRLGFALLLKFFEMEGRFPACPEEVPAVAVEYVAGLVKVDPVLFTKCRWSGRTPVRHGVLEALADRRLGVTAVGTHDPSLGSCVPTEASTDHQPIARRSAVDTYTEDDVATWRQVVGSLRRNAVDDHDLRMVDEGAAVISSGAGLFTTLPEPIARLLLQAIEAGYGQALRDVRDGRVDGLGPLL